MTRRGETDDGTSMMLFHSDQDGQAHVWNNPNRARKPFEEKFSYATSA